MDEFRRNRMKSYAIAQGLFTSKAHIAVIAVNYEGFKFLCDLGDQWIQPILIDPESVDFTEEQTDGFFPAARTKVKVHSNEVEISYIRSNGKERKQRYDLSLIDDKELLTAEGHSQNLLRHPLVERRLFLTNEIQHWEFDRWNSFISTNNGLILESKLDEMEEWIDRIHTRTNINKSIIRIALEVYTQTNK